MEIVIKTSSKIVPSDKNIDTSKIDFDGDIAPVVLLKVINEKKVFDLMSVRVKVVAVFEAETLESGNVKQELIIVDSTGSGRAAIWGDNVGKSYLLSCFMVKEFGRRKYLSMRKEVSKIEEIEDITDAAEVEVDHFVTDKVLKNSSIIAVYEFVHKKVCH